MLYMCIFLSCGAYGEYESTVSSSGGHQGQQAISVDVPVTLVVPTARPDQCLQCYAWLKNVFCWKFMLGINLIL